MKLISWVLKLLCKSHLSKLTLSELKYEVTLRDNMLLCKCATVVRNVLSGWRQGVFLELRTFGLVLLWGSVWFWSSFTLRLPPGLAVHCSALYQLLKIMKQEDRLDLSWTHNRNENRRARTVEQSNRHPSSAQEMEQTCFSSCPVAGLQTAGMKGQCHSGLGLLTSAQLLSVLIKISPRQNLCQTSASVAIPGCALLWLSPRNGWVPEETRKLPKTVAALSAHSIPSVLP